LKFQLFLDTIQNADTEETAYFITRRRNQDLETLNTVHFNNTAEFGIWGENVYIKVLNWITVLRKINTLHITAII